MRYTFPTSVHGLKDGNTRKELVTRAIASTILDHGLLQAGIIDQGTTEPKFVELREIDLNRQIAWEILEEGGSKYDAHVLERVTSILDTPFDQPNRLPAWRVIVFYSRAHNFIDVDFNLQHAMCDGAAARIFHLTFLKYLNGQQLCNTRLSSALQNSILSLEGLKTNYPLAMDKMCDIPTPESFPDPPGSELLASWAPIVTGPVKTRRKIISIDSSTTKRIIKTCRANSSTITGLLHGITLLCLATQLSEEQAKAFSAGTAIDMRKYVPEEYKADHIIGNIVSNCSHQFDEHFVSNIRRMASAREDGKVKAVWQTASIIREDLQKKSNDGFKNDANAILPYIEDWTATRLAGLSSPRSSSWAVSNLGVLNPGQAKSVQMQGPKDEWQITRAELASSADTSGPAILIQVVSVAEGDMVINLTWQVGTVVDDGLGEIMARDLRNYLHHFSSADEK